MNQYSLTPLRISHLNFIPKFSLVYCYQQCEKVFDPATMLKMDGPKPSNAH